MAAWPVAIAATLLWPLAASASEELVARYGAALNQCYDQADGAGAREKCIGATADPCITGEADGESTLGMTQCLYSEAEVWDGLLNTEYRATMAWAKMMDQDDAQDFPEYANRAKALRAAQRAWIPFRDAECGFDYAVWGAGSMRNIAIAGCLMRLTADRTIELRAKRETFE